ncbi:hypothetical protein MKW92_048551 [Papaver armeniacum]|nr:hypothetical protein MKW92_048551 [Papaver armeniacum]
MSALIARTGRHRQRYENDFRLVAVSHFPFLTFRFHFDLCIPYRIKKDGEDDTVDCESRLNLWCHLLIEKTLFSQRYGGWEDDETIGEAACREALEEAGVKGILDGSPLGMWEFRSKSRQNSCSTEGSCRGYMFALEVTEELDTWPEEDKHGRRWVKSFRLCRYEWMRRALNVFLTVLSELGKYEMKEDELTELDATSDDAVSVADVVMGDHQIRSPSCFLKSSGVPATWQ